VQTVWKCSARANVWVKCISRGELQLKLATTSKLLMQVGVHTLRPAPIFFACRRSFHVECAWRHLATHSASSAKAEELLLGSYEQLLVVAFGRGRPSTLQAASRVRDFLLAHEKFPRALPVLRHLQEQFAERVAAAARRCLRRRGSWALCASA
jgi:hypothetical protein